MFRSPVNPIIRLVFAPSLLLFYLVSNGAFMPMLAPIFVVIFLTLMPSRPPLGMLLKLLVALLLISFGVILIGETLIDSPTGYGLFCWSLLFGCFYRSHQNPKDILATLTMLVVIIMAVMNLQFGVSSIGLPWLMFEGFVIALIVTYMSFLLFPGDEKDILPDEEDTEGAQAHIGLIVFKATAMSLVLAALIMSGSSQAILIAITISSMIKIPISRDHRIFSQHRLVTTAIGILFTIPVMLSSNIGMPIWALMGVTVFCSIQLACYAIRRQCKLSIYQLLFTNFIVLISQVLTYQGEDPFSSHFTRLVSIGLAIFIGSLMLNLVQKQPSKSTATA
ncbi:DUF2955 domain-containing protein [Enterovibrio sp. 27052020O]|uniref:DUF2955 domain-containing protein n=1 Tax=Enterovibrio sp. 27052020O TaxID=3241166 RepID=UPI00389103B9